MKSLKSLISKKDINKFSQKREFNIHNMNTGDVVKLRNGTYYIVDMLEERFGYFDDFFDLSDYTEDGKCAWNEKKYDIIEYYPKNNSLLLTPIRSYRQSDIMRWVSKRENDYINVN